MDIDATISGPVASLPREGRAGLLAARAMLLDGRRLVPAGAEMESRSIPLRTGVTLDVGLAGSGEGTPLLFLHGATDSRHSFASVLERLPREISAVLPSFRGHGDSERPMCCYGVTDHISDLIALLDELGFPKATIVAHSLGSFVAQRLAIEHPDRVERLVLVGSGSRPDSEPIVRLTEEVHRLPDPVPTGYVREFQEGTARAPVERAVMERAIAESLKLPARVWRDIFDGLLVSGSRDRLAEITAPTLLISGALDDLYPEPFQTELRDAIPGSRLVVYEGTGHAVHWEWPDRFTTDLISFVRAEASKN